MNSCYTLPEKIYFQAYKKAAKEQTKSFSYPEVDFKVIRNGILKVIQICILFSSSLLKSEMIFHYKTLKMPTVCWVTKNNDLPSLTSCRYSKYVIECITLRYFLAFMLQKTAAHKNWADLKTHKNIIKIKEILIFYCIQGDSK